MLNSRIYTRYFPVLNGVTQFNEEEKRILCRWAKVFPIDVFELECRNYHKGITHFQSFDMSRYDEKLMVDMINQNRFDDKYLAMLNIIIYRHKYNELLSRILWPVLTKEKAINFIAKCLRKKDE